MKTYLKPVIELIDLQAAGFIMGLADASNPDHIMTTPNPVQRKRTPVF